MADRNHDAAADFMSRPGRKPATPVAAATASSPLSAQQQRLDAQLAIGQGGPQVAGAVASLQALQGQLGMRAPALVGQLILSLLETPNPDEHGVPTSKLYLSSLPLVTVPDDAECAVCMDLFPPPNKACRLPCKHLFHDECLRPWLSVRNTCPMCRLELPTDDPAHEAERARKRLNALPEVKKDTEPVYDPFYH